MTEEQEAIAKEKRKEYDQWYRKLHSKDPYYVEQRKKRHKKYYLNHLELCNKQSREYYAAHKEELAAKARQRYWDNKKKQEIS